MLNTIKEDLPQYDFLSETTSNGLHWTERELENPKNKIRLATMFSGIGAIEYALKRLKISNEIVFASDNDKFVKESYYANYEIDDERWYDDVKDIDGKKYLNKIDLLVGGSPCQSFSMIGKRKGFKDTRGHYFMTLLEL
ncbi:hypothetical protein BSPWISOXPB_2381 [uncultured Gammaproteobacteria bacterium]|nr:hypothetical protein BSPWISOXPB_2381 [uncultured Gammaproteobacteria bacterium]